MRWVRRHERVGRWVALFALALQLTLSFGHVHLDNTAPSPASVASVLPSQAASGDAPSDPDRHSAGHDFCAICATISLASTLLLPEPSGLMLPTAGPHRWLQDLEIARPLPEPHLSFQARGPPAAA
jgi:hypothetical protein